MKQLFPKIADNYIEILASQNQQKAVERILSKLPSHQADWYLRQLEAAEASRSFWSWLF